MLVLGLDRERKNEKDRALEGVSKLESERGRVREVE